MKLQFAAIAIALVFLFLSCNQNSSENQKDNIAGVRNEKQEDQNYQSSDTTVAPSGNRIDNPSSKEDWNRKIIRIGTMSMQVKEYKKYYEVLSDVVKREGGYIAQEDQQQTEYKIENNVLIKVPVDRFQETMDLISRGTGNEEIKEKKITSDDVTTEVIDTKSRIEAKKQVRERYLDLLKEAKNMKDILTVQSEINNIQEEMETASGRVNYLNHASSYSTINLTFFQVLNAQAVDNKEPSFTVKFLNAFRSGWNFIKALILGVVSIWPFWFFLAGILIAVKKWKPNGKRHITS